MVCSRNKGKNGELELKDFLMNFGFSARRGQQFSGGGDSPDVVCPELADIHWECKRVEAGNLYNWLAQAIRDCGKKIPVVAHRRSRQDWVAIMRLDDFLVMQARIKELEHGNSGKA